MKNPIKLAVYYLAKKIGLFNISHRLTQRHPRILCYHGGSIGDEHLYNGYLFMSRSKFESRIRWLKKKNYNFATLDEILAGRTENKNSKNLVALTFDDGWYSTAKMLLPILRAEKIPSTLYLSTNSFLKAIPIIPVIIRYIVSKATSPSIKLEEIDSAIDGFYNIKNSESVSELIDRFSNWVDKHKPSKEKVEFSIEQIAEKSGLALDDLNIHSLRFSYLSSDEILDCTRSGCSIELHGHIHRYPMGDPEEFSADLALCANVITNLSLPYPKHYCYPSGKFDESSADILKEHGILSATTCRSGLVSDTSGRLSFYLPRFLDGENVHMLEFEAEMTGFSELMRIIFKPRSFRTLTFAD